MSQIPGDVPVSEVVAPSKDERMWGMLCHLTALSGYVGLPLGNIIGPLVVWLLKKEGMPFVDEQGKESLNFQISLFVYFLVSFVLMFVVIGIFLMMGLYVFGLIMTIIASIKANGGERYRYPLTIRFLK